MTIKKLYIQPSELCQQLGISRSTLQKWEKQFPEFPSKFKINQTVLYRLADVEVWIESKATELKKVAK